MLCLAATVKVSPKLLFIASRALDMVLEPALELEGCELGHFDLEQLARLHIVYVSFKKIPQLLKVNHFVHSEVS